MSWLKKFIPGGAAEEGNATVANLGSENTMYFCPDRKRWVERGREAEMDAELAKANAPPPLPSFKKTGISAPAMNTRYVDSFALMGLSKPREENSDTPPVTRGLFIVPPGPPMPPPPDVPAESLENSTRETIAVSEPLPEDPQEVLPATNQWQSHHQETAQSTAYFQHHESHYEEYQFDWRQEDWNRRQPVDHDHPPASQEAEVEPDSNGYALEHSEQGPYVQPFPESVDEPRSAVIGGEELQWNLQTESPQLERLSEATHNHMAPSWDYAQMTDPNESIAQRDLSLDGSLQPQGDQDELRTFEGGIQVDSCWEENLKVDETIDHQTQKQAKVESEETGLDNADELMMSEGTFDPECRAFCIETEKYSFSYGQEISHETIDYLAFVVREMGDEIAVRAALGSLWNVALAKAEQTLDFAQISTKALEIWGHRSEGVVRAALGVLRTLRTLDGNEKHVVEVLRRVKAEDDRTKDALAQVAARLIIRGSNLEDRLVGRWTRAITNVGSK